MFSAGSRPRCRWRSQPLRTLQSRQLQPLRTLLVSKLLEDTKPDLEPSCLESPGNGDGGGACGYQCSSVTARAALGLSVDIRGLFGSRHRSLSLATYCRDATVAVCATRGGFVTQPHGASRTPLHQRMPWHCNALKIDTEKKMSIGPPTQPRSAPSCPKLPGCDACIDFVVDVISNDLFSSSPLCGPCCRWCWQIGSPSARGSSRKLRSSWRRRRDRPACHHHSVHHQDGNQGMTRHKPRSANRAPVEDFTS